MHYNVKSTTYKITTECDIILQVYYITFRYKSNIYIMYNTKDAHELRENPVR